MDNHLKKEDFISSNEVKWCPGCGDYAIIAAIQKLLPELGLLPEKHVFISGIGCAGRLPYYMNTYGFHTIHGRALAVATGLKSMRPDLTVWVITGDGDALSIGGNHFIHCLRRNLDINILLINNQIYGLTKGQFSPTSVSGQVTKTSPSGVVGHSVNPVALALASGASFVARAVDKDLKQLMLILRQAYEHVGTAFVEIYQNCHVFNAGAFDNFATKENRAENTISLEDGKPMFFGKQLDKALAFNANEFAVVDCEADNICVHNIQDKMAAYRLGYLDNKQFPVPLGVYYKEMRAVYSLVTNINKTQDDLMQLLRGNAFWREGI